MMAMTEKELTDNIAANITANRKNGQPALNPAQVQAQAARIYGCVKEIIENLNAGAATGVEIETYIKRYRANQNDPKSTIDFEKLKNQLSVDTDTTAKNIELRLGTDPYYTKVFKAVRKQINDAFTLFGPTPTTQVSDASLAGHYRELVSTASASR